MKLERAMLVIAKENNSNSHDYIWKFFILKVKKLYITNYNYIYVNS